MAVNARGPFLCYKYAAEQMIKQGRGGRIIGASSVAAQMGFPLGAPYCASKWAVRGLTQTAGEDHVVLLSNGLLIRAALELGRYGITVNSYAPGLIQTPLSECWTRYLIVVSLSLYSGRVDEPDCTGKCG
jgi:NAD(P)-dependent dehydrogenase (short-subunit alcohol dehydrogenase family)